MKSSGKVEFLTENELKIEIKDKNFAPCYLLFGEEHFLIKGYLQKIISSTVSDMEDFNVNRFDGAVKLQSVYDAVTSFPMMADKKVVTLCDYPYEKGAASENEKLLKTIEDIPSTTCFVIWFETVEINPKKPGDKLNGLFKAVIEAGGHVCYLGRKSVSDIMKMLQSGAARRKCKLEPTTARYMVEVCSDDLSMLINELEKLCVYVGENGIITNETVDKVCSRSTEASVYNISKAVLRGDLSEAYKTLDDLLYMNTDPALILSTLAGAYIDMYRVFVARSTGKHADEIAKDFGYFNTAFRLTEAERNVKRFEKQQLVDFLDILRDADSVVKSSRCDGRVVLEKTIAQLALIGSGGKR